MALKANGWRSIGASDALFPAGVWDLYSMGWAGGAGDDEENGTATHSSGGSYGEQSVGSFWADVGFGTIDVRPWGDLSECWLRTSRSGLVNDQLAWLDGISPSDVASAWAMVTVGSPSLTTKVYDYEWEDDVPSAVASSYWVAAKGQYHNGYLGETVDTTPSCSLHFMALKKSGSGLVPSVVSSLGTASTFSDGVATKTDVTALVRAYLSHKGTSYCFQPLLVPGAGVDLTPNSDIQGLCEAIKALYYENTISASSLEYYDDYLVSGYRYWAPPGSSVTTRELTWGSLSIGTIYVRLSGGVVLSSGSRVFYGLPPAFQPGS